MATKLFLRNTSNNGISGYFDMVIGAGASEDTGVVAVDAVDTEVPWTDVEDGTPIKWISGRVPSGGFTLTNGTYSVWVREGVANHNVALRGRIYKYTGSESELGGSPFDLGEVTTTPTEYTSATDVTDTAFAENDRIVFELNAIPNGTFKNGGNATMYFNAADASQGDSYYEITENVIFKLEAGFENTGSFASWFF